MSKDMIDITIVATRRPELLSITLEAFSRRVFSHFNIGNVFVNIDPFFGDEKDETDCIEILNSHFHDPIVHLPEHFGFGAAVKRLWGMVESPYVFHLEDDWIAKEDIFPQQVFPKFRDDFKVVIPLCKEFRWDGRDPVIMKKTGEKKRFMGLPYKTEKMGYFGTSPRFLEGEFARKVSKLMDPGLDPEKQQRPRPLTNPRLVEFLKNYRSVLLPGTNNGCLIEDIGRDWREERGIKKQYTLSGATQWTFNSK